MQECVVTIVRMPSAIEDPFPEVPLLAGRMRLRADLSTLSEADLERLWVDVYKYRYLAALVVGNNPLARPRIEALRDYHERIAARWGWQRDDLSVQGEWIEEERLHLGREREIEDVLADESLVPDDFVLEHLPVYSSGDSLLYVLHARAHLRQEFSAAGQLITAADWRQAHSRHLYKSISFRYYRSGVLARGGVRKYVLPVTLQDLAARLPGSR